MAQIATERSDLTEGKSAPAGGLRLLEEDENRVLALREAIQEGIESGIAYDFNPETHLQGLKTKKKL